MTADALESKQTRSCLVRARSEAGHEMNGVGFWAPE